MYTTMLQAKLHRARVTHSELEQPIRVPAPSTATFWTRHAWYSVDDLNRTPLHYACMGRNGWIAEQNWLAEEFIQKCNVEHISIQDTFGKTALYCAAMANSQNLIELLKTKKEQMSKFEINVEKMLMNT